MMVEITGNQHLIGVPATLLGYQLCVQKLSQVPNTQIERPGMMPLVSPRQVLIPIWPEGFESYTIIRTNTWHVTVAGMVWWLTPFERELVREWEMIDYGWYEEMRGYAIVEGQSNFQQVVTEGLRGRRYDRIVNGTCYPPLLNRWRDFKRNAKQTREEFLDRIALHLAEHRLGNT